LKNNAPQKKDQACIFQSQRSPGSTKIGCFNVQEKRGKDVFEIKDPSIEVPGKEKQEVREELR